MIKTLFSAISSSARSLLRFWRALIIFFLLFASMLGAVYLFFAGRETTTVQLLLNVVLALAVPVLFFILQTMAVRFTHTQGHAKTLTVGALRDFWKLLLISLPMIAVVGVLVYLLAQIKVGPEQAAVIPPPPRGAVTRAAPPLQWEAVAIVSIQYLLLCLVLPLSLIHLWIVTARDGLKAGIKGIVRALGEPLRRRRADHLIGFVVFAASRISCCSARRRFEYLARHRVVKAACCSHCCCRLGWLITLGALAQLTNEMSIWEASEREQEPLYCD
jgi:hypothetical protein